MRLAILFCLALAACPKPTPPPAPPPVDIGLASCKPPVDVRPEDVCDGVFTVAGLACANCRGGAKGCVDGVDVIYCAANGCLNDANCVADAEPTNEGARRRSHKKR